MYGWDEYETVHRVSPYLVGVVEALEWFKWWKISDRKWSNFIIELRCSFSRRIDFGIRFEMESECTKKKKKGARGHVYCTDCAKLGAISTAI
jgi:hypothetical protein